MKKIIDIERLFRGTRSAGVEWIIHNEDNVSLYATILKKNKKELIIENSPGPVMSCNDLKQYLTADIPVNLAVNGKGVFHKKVFVSGSDTAQTLLQKALPNAHPDEFYIQKTPLGSDQAYISVIRKKSLDNIVKEFEKNRWPVVSCSLGPFIAAPLMPLIENKNEIIHFNGCYLKSDGGTIKDFGRKENELKNEYITISGQKINTARALSYLSAITYFIPSQKIPSVADIGTEVKKEEFIQKQVFKSAAIAVAAFIFILLVVNSWLFLSLSGQRESLVSKAAATEEIAASFDSINKIAEGKKIFLKQSGFLENSRISFFSDRIAEGMPESIKLTELNFYPAIKKTFGENSMLFKKDTVLLSGQCTKSIYLNEWIEKLKQQQWISKINIVSYNQDKTEPKAEFRLELVLQ